MIDKELLKIIYCPNCHNNLTLKQNELICSHCQKAYNVSGDIPLLINKEIIDDQKDLKINKEKWHSFYENYDWEEERMTYEPSNLPYIYRHLLPLKKNSLVLEIGSGASFLSFDLSKKGHRVVCVDFDLDILKMAKRHFQKHKIKAYFVCANIKNLPFKKNIFDVSIGMGVIEHSREINKLVNEIGRITKKTGKTFQTVPWLSITTLTFGQRYGTIPHVPILKEIFSFFHVKLLGARHMKYGYEESFSLGFLQKTFKKAEFKKINLGFYDYNQTILKHHKALSKFFYKVIRLRFFGNIAFISAHK